MKHRLFVYGTLKHSYGLNSILTNSGYLGAATTSPEYTLLDSRLFPFLVKRNGIGARGELYAVDDATLNAIDEVEGHPNFYERKKILVRDNNGIEQRVFAYIHPDDSRMQNLVEIFEWSR